METLLDVLHVVSAVFIVGPMAILPMTGMRALRAGERGQVATLAKSTYVFSLLSLLVVFFGFGALGSSDKQAHLSITTSWILSAFIVYLVALVLSLFVVVPAMRQAGENPHDAVAGELAASSYQRIAMGSGLVSLLLVVVVVLMVWQP
jgi:uncharacterized membrane protein